MGYVGTIINIEDNSITVTVDANEFGELMQLDGTTIKVLVNQDTSIYSVGQKIKIKIPTQIIEVQGEVHPYGKSIY